MVTPRLRPRWLLVDADSTILGVPAIRPGRGDPMCGRVDSSRVLPRGGGLTCWCLLIAEALAPPPWLRRSQFVISAGVLPH